MEAVQYKCPNCGGELQFKPDKQLFGCDYCLSTFTEDEIKTICSRTENSIDDAEKSAREEFETHTNIYHCGSCGAEIMCEDIQTATFCYYCHEPVILSGRMSGDYKPNKVIAFKLTRDEAEKNFHEWCSGRFFLPKNFNTNKQLEKMTGLYVPFWVADCNVNANYSAIAEKHRSWTQGNYRYTEIKDFEVIRDAHIFANGVPADGESKIDDDLMEAIEPFNYTEAADFSMSYLSGFFADKYDVDKAAVFPRVKERVNQAARSIIQESVNNYTQVHVNNENYRIMDTKWQYMLLPVWFMTYRYNGEVYSFAINGQTGKLAGTPPLDKKKLALVSTAIGIIAAIIILLITEVFLS